VFMSFSEEEKDKSSIQGHCFLWEMIVCCIRAVFLQLQNGEHTERKKKPENGRVPL